MTTRTAGNEPTAQPDQPDDWPELISSRAYVHYEDKHYVAVLERFSIYGIGETPVEAWQQMDEHAKSYFDLCEQQGLPFDEVVRPITVRDRIRLQAWFLVARALHKVLRDGRRGEQRQHFVHPHPDGEHAHALAC